MTDVTGADVVRRAHPRVSDRTELCMALREAWGRSQRVFNSRTVQTWYLSEVGSEYAELPDRTLLTSIVDRGPIRLTDLAASVGRTVSNVSKVVHGLVINGYVVRRIPDYDRRVTLLEATELGRTVAHRIIALDIRVIGHHVEPFEDDELSALVGLLTRFADRIVEWEGSGLELGADGARDGTTRTINDTHPHLTSGGIS